MHSLRPYQLDALSRSKEAYDKGINRQLAVLATGLGKTAIAANLRAHHGFTKPIIFLVHYETLAVQAATAMQRWNPGLRVAVEMAGSYANMDGFYPPQFIVASVPTLGRKGSDRIKRFLPGDFAAVIQDECFPAGTLVGERRIETIRIGDLIPSVDVGTGKIEPKRVTGISRRCATSLVKLHFNNGDSLTCTPEHPFWTSEHKWVAAKNLKHHTVARRYYVQPILRGMRDALSKEVLDRGRRRFSFLNDSQGAGSEEGYVFEGTRVDRVEVLEPTSPEFTGSMLGTCEVYNLAVEGHNNYLADGYLVHNCHIGMADSFKRVYAHFGLLAPNPEGMLFLGITATPNRADGQGLRDLFDAIVFDMGIQKGIADGWLCDIRGIRVSGHANLDKVKVRAGEFAQDDLEKAVNTPKRNAIIVKEWYKHAFGRRTIAFTVDVQHALDLAEAFKAHGVDAKAVWGDDPERHEKIRGHKTGEYPIIACAQLLGIGYDDPLVNCIILSAPRKSFVRYAQEVGRGTRIADGKEDLLVIDVGDNASRHNLCSISTLLGLPKDLDLKGESYSKAKQKLDRIAQEFPTANVQDIKSLDQLKSIAENISLFQPNYPPEIARLSELAWRKSGDGYCLAVSRDMVSIAQDLRGDWQIRGRVGDAVAEFSAQNLPGAMNVADRFVLDHGGVKGYLKRDTKWRGEPPTERQISLCGILRIAVPPGATKGQVSAAIDAKRIAMNQSRPKPGPEYKGEY